MAAFLSIPASTVFSSCSLSDLSALNDDSCLFNVPTNVVGDPVCGNWIIEENEACDCGTPEECSNDCCNATTCQPVAGAQCASGACCTNQCMVAAMGECRASSGDCDIAEFCSGDSNECPEDEFVANGVSCNLDTGYCMDGECPTRDAQCLASFSKQHSKYVVKVV